MAGQFHQIGNLNLGVESKRMCHTFELEDHFLKYGTSLYIFGLYMYGWLLNTQTLNIFI